MGGELGSARNLLCWRERTLPLVSEQQPRNYASVTVRCLPCRRRRGDAPTLAVLERAPGERWLIRVMQRRRSIAAMRLLEARGMDLVDLAADTTELLHRRDVTAFLHLADDDDQTVEIDGQTVETVRSRIFRSLRML